MDKGGDIPNSFLTDSIKTCPKLTSVRKSILLIFIKLAIEKNEKQNLRNKIIIRARLFTCRIP